MIQNQKAEVWENMERGLSEVNGKAKHCLHAWNWYLLSPSYVSVFSSIWLSQNLNSTLAPFSVKALPDESYCIPSLFFEKPSNGEI